MGNLSKHFDLSEFECRCGCRSAIIHDELIHVLEKARDHFNAQIKITSGTRCEKHNAEIGGAPKSQHLYGIAADIQVKGYSPSQVAGYFNKLYPDTYGIGKYNGWTHIDIRPVKARWDLVGGDA
jgi:uncharacterized protein YcbK (DUF882 family)